MRYVRLWFFFTRAWFAVSFASRSGAMVFMIGKALRLTVYLLVLSIIFSATPSFAGYTHAEALLMLFTFTLVDSISQFLFREVYRFRESLVSGSFDYDLLRPIPTLFRSLLGGADGMDLVMLLPYGAATVWVLLGFSPSPWQVGAYLLFVLLGVLLSAAFHVLVLAFAIRTTVVDNLIMVYRDISGMGRFPVQIYSSGVQFLLTFVVPVSVMVMAPSSIMIDHIPKIYGLLSLGSVGFLFLSLFVWKRALRGYTSASS